MSAEPIPDDGPDAVPEAESPRSSRGRLIEAGTRLFRAHGYRRVSLDRILRESGVCRSNFYYHFRGKQDLALTVIDEWRKEQWERIVEPILRDERFGPLAKARAIVDGLIDRLEERHCRGGCPFGTLANAEAEHNEKIRGRLITIFDEMTGLFQELYTEARDRGQLRQSVAAPEDLATITVAMVQGGYLLSKTYADAMRMRFAAQSWFDSLDAEVDEPGAQAVSDVRGGAQPA